jgi:hypothetical protein
MYAYASQKMKVYVYYSVAKFELYKLVILIWKM